MISAVRFSMAAEPAAAPAAVEPGVGVSAEETATERPAISFNCDLMRSDSAGKVRYLPLVAFSMAVLSLSRSVVKGWRTLS